jgi:hypothetical protein
MGRLALGDFFARHGKQKGEPGLAGSGSAGPGIPVRHEIPVA